VAYGKKAWLGIGKETTWGQSAAIVHYIPFVSEGMSYVIEDLIQEGMRARYDEPPSMQGLKTVAGDIVFDAHPITLGHFLRSVCGQVSTTPGSVYAHEFVPRQADFSSVCALPPYTIEVFRGEGLSFFTFGGVVNVLGLTCGAGQRTLRATASVIGKSVTQASGTTASYLTGDPFTWAQCSVSLKGAGFVDFEDLTIRLENNVEGLPFLSAEQVISKILRTDYRRVGVSGTLHFETQSQYAEFAQGSENPLIVTFANQSLQLQIQVPKLRYVTFPLAVGGPGRISVGFDGVGRFDTTSNYAIRFVLSNTLSAY